MTKEDDLRKELALANRILAREGVVDAYGHVSRRHPDRPDRFLLSCSRSPELVVPADLMEFRPRRPQMRRGPVRGPNTRSPSDRPIGDRRGTDPRASLRASRPERCVSSSGSGLGCQGRREEDED